MSIIIGAILAIAAALTALFLRAKSAINQARHVGRLEGAAIGAEEERKATAARIQAQRAEQRTIEEERAELADGYEAEKTVVDLKLQRELEQPAPSSPAEAEADAQRRIDAAIAASLEDEHEAPTVAVKLR